MYVIPMALRHSRGQLGLRLHNCYVVKHMMTVTEGVPLTYAQDSSEGHQPAPVSEYALPDDADTGGDGWGYTS